jgi:heme exporter protein CcmD
MQGAAMQIYLIAAYAIFWLLPFVLILTIWIRQRRIEREIAALEARLTE